MAGKPSAPGNPAIGALVRRLRESRGVRMIDLARAIQVTPPYLSLVESGKRKLTQKRANQIANVLDIDPFCAGCGGPYPNPALGEDHG